MQVAERPHDREPDSTGDVSVVAHGRRDRIPDHHARAELHHEELRADDRLVLAHQQRSRRGRKRLPEPRQYPVLPGHVVRTGRDPPEGRAPEHQRLRAEPQQVGEIGRAIGELEHGQLAVQAREPFPEERGRAGPVQFLSWPNRGDLSRVRDRHQLPHTPLSAGLAGQPGSSSGQKPSIADTDETALTPPAGVTRIRKPSITQRLVILTFSYYRVDGVTSMPRSHRAPQ
jgi:hypothetical protein